MRSKYSFLIWLIGLLTWQLWVCPVSAQTSTGFTSPSATGVTYNQWTNPSNAYTDNATYATAVAKASTSPKEQGYSSYGWSIPTGSTINGIEVKVQSYVSNTTGHTLYVNIYRAGGATWATSKTLTLNASEQEQTVGSSSDLWGQTGWQASDFTNANFNSMIHWTVSGTTNRTAYLDLIQINVHYTPPADLGKSIDGMSNIISIDGMSVTSGNTVDGM